MGFSLIRGNSKICKCCGSVLIESSFTLLKPDALPFIMESVENLTNVTREEMCQRRGPEHVMLARHLFHLAAFNFTTSDQITIASETGKDRTTIASSLKISKDLLKTNEWFIKNYSRLSKVIEYKFKKKENVAENY